MKHITELSVRSYECDSYGHVNNAVYLNYLEFARMDFLDASGFRYKDFVAAGFTPEEYRLITENDRMPYKVRFWLLEEIAKWFDKP